MKTILIILLFVPSVFIAQFGNQDFGIWGGVSASGEVMDGLKLSGDFQFRTDDNSSRLNQCFLDFGAKYKFNKHFRSGLSWRPRMVNERYGYQLENRLYLDLTGKLKVGGVALYLRSRTQTTSNKNAENPCFERLRFKTVFKLDKGLKAFIQDELFFRINGSGISKYTKNRFGIGLKYSINRSIEIGLKYLRIVEKNAYYPLRMNVIAFGVGYSIG